MNIYIQENQDKNYCIYKITNLISGKSYIGQTCNFDRRMYYHCSYGGSVISSAILKYGKDNFSFEIIEPNLLIEAANTQEQYFIEYYNTLSPNGYNLTTGGLNHTISEETRLKRTGENHWAYGLKGEEHPLYGRKHTEEHILKTTGENHWTFGVLSEDHPNRGENHWTFGMLSEDHYWFGKNHTEETKLKVSGENHYTFGMSHEDHPLYDKKWTEETFQKHREQFLITFPDNHQEINNNLKQFCKDNNLSYSCMIFIANGRKNPIHKGFKCEHYNP